MNENGFTMDVFIGIKNTPIPWDFFLLFGVSVVTVAKDPPSTSMQDINKWHTFQTTDKFDLNDLNDNEYYYIHVIHIYVACALNNENNKRHQSGRDFQKNYSDLKNRAVIGDTSGELPFPLLQNPLAQF